MGGTCVVVLGGGGGGGGGARFGVASSSTHLGDVVEGASCLAKLAVQGERWIEPKGNAPGVLFLRGQLAQGHGDACGVCICVCWVFCVMCVRQT